MAEGCWPKYGALCVKVADGSNRVQGAQPLQVMNESNSLEVKLDTILSLLDPSSSDAFTDELNRKQESYGLSLEQAIHELRADKIIEHFAQNGGKDPVSQMMTDWFDTFEYAVNNTDLLPGFEKQICRIAKVIINRAYVENTRENESASACNQSFCRYSEDGGFPVIINGQEVNMTILQICGEGYRERIIGREDVVEKIFGCFRRKKPYRSYKRDFTPIAKCIIDNDPDVVNMSDDALVAALNYRNDNLASLLIERRPQKARIRQLFEHQGIDSQKVSFKDIVEDPNMKKTVVAVLDCLVSQEIGLKMNPGNDQEESGQLAISDDPIRYHFFYQILDGDDKGRPPRRMKQLSMSSPAQALVTKREFLYCKEFNLHSKSCLQALCQSSHKATINHPVVRTLARRKWDFYGERRIWMYAFNFVLYLGLLITALLLAATSKDPKKYPQSIDRFRGFCEVLTVLCTLVYLVLEFDQMLKDSPWYYFREFFNWVDLFGIFTILSLIPLRFSDVRAQWIVSSFACILNFLRIYKYFPASKDVGVYAKTLTILIKKDLKIFGIFYLFVLLMFCSAIYMALRSFSRSSGFDHADVSGFSDVLFRELRSLVQSEGFSSTYKQYSVFSTILIMTSMFVTMVFLINLLIAQLSNTYNQASEAANINHDISKALFVSQLDNSRFLFWNPRVEYYAPGSYEHDKDKMKELFDKWESVKSAKSFDES